MPIDPPHPELAPLEQLRGIVALLRGPGGCPWDREQTHATLRGGLLEEAYEVVAAIDSSDDANLREELGDLLLQVFFHCQIAAEEGRFTVDDAARDITEKLIRRHPHVFATETAADSGAVLRRWDEIKRAEKRAANGTLAPSVLDGLTPGLPSLLHAEKAQKRAAKAGFDWNAASDVLPKIREELAEVEAAMNGGSASELEEEIGDLLFSVVNLARKVHVESEVALRRATEKFIQRFQAVEQIAAARGERLESLGLTRLDAIWDEVKKSASRSSEGR